MYVVQEHDGHGLHDTFVVAKGTNGLWQWFGVSYDDLYWRTVGYKHLSNGNVVVYKYGLPVAEFDPTNFTVTARGREDTAWKETSDLLRQ